MKKVLLVAVAGLFVFASCKKDYSCVCKNGSEEYSTANYEDVKKKDAQESCDAVKTTVQAYFPSVTCSLEEK